MIPSRLELTRHPQQDIGIKILSVSNMLFDSVKKSPPSIRENFPAILRKNNFALTLRVTHQYAFLEVTTKLKARREQDSSRVDKYQHIFVPHESNKPAAILIDESRLCRINKMTVEGVAGVIQIGKNSSFCIQDLQHNFVKNGREFKQNIELLYVVGFGNKIYPEDAWQEFDSLIRVTLSDWSKI